jgi:hypothetical protein
VCPVFSMNNAIPYFTTICLFLLGSVAFGAQSSFTIPVGTTPFGPISVNVLHRFTKFEGGFITLAPGQTISGEIQYSTDKGKTWSFLCGFVSDQPIPTPKPFFRGCEFPEGTTSIQGVVVVTGKSVTITATPSLTSR